MENFNLIGRKIADFKLPAYHDGKFIEVSNETIKGSWAVFMFYPADFTFVCPTELADLGHVYPQFKEIGCKVFSVSTDSEFVHKAWADATDTIRNLPYPMISDKTGKFADSFGILIHDAWQALRGTFVIDPNGIIKAYEVHDLGIGRDADELLRKVEAAQFVEKHGDQVCPAKWRPGSKTLTPGIDLVGKL
ncbi:peroxiredoxin [Treponema phagedenis]|uniref:Alkyl hydroperoxide reductase C n=1 Tax=Treponema phagedenis TaxID=162 RepID=A0A0B7GXQ1_TREPH|nr:alkyl hydroperoxide reductase subunit C [Treponema phagedenis]EFW37339.1 peroxiredoxin [Treponema phagedenis F0421]NVP24351.1 peroxiredoxin [Treponema phagedenis]QEJ96045.1 peroxiredoxin [Treponema phagedenis]QEJ99055.1 peroxiredoxin [Treponema phagedenis]QEK01808.1 peroxiredoxin [Treponema phagedenis]